MCEQCTNDAPDDGLPECPETHQRTGESQVTAVEFGGYLVAVNLDGGEDGPTISVRCSVSETTARSLAHYITKPGGFRVGVEGERQPTDQNRAIEERLVVTDLCDMHAFHKDLNDGRMGRVLRRAINFIEGRKCFGLEDDSLDDQRSEPAQPIINNLNDSVTAPLKTEAEEIIPSELLHTCPWGTPGLFPNCNACVIEMRRGVGKSLAFGWPAGERRESPEPEHPEVRAIRVMAAAFEKLGDEPCEECGWSLNEIRDFVHIVVAARAWRKGKRKGYSGGDLTAERLIEAVDASESSSKGDSK